MKVFRYVLVVILTLWAGSVRQEAMADSGVLALKCGYASFGAEEKNEPPKMRKYAPDREVDVLHLIIDVTPDFKARTVSGKTSLRFVPIAQPLKELRLNAVDLTIFSVESSAKISAYQVTDEAVVITFAEPIPPGVETTVTVTHEAEPKKGLYFRTPEMGYRPEDTHLWTQGEPHRARHWYPSFDYPNERFTSEVICRVPEEMVVLSNGRLVSEEVNAATGLKAVRWLQDKPHVNYLIAIVAGKMARIEDRYKNIPLAFYTPTSQIAQAENSFHMTADMMDFFERETGVPYPWDQYNQVVVDDFITGGMENTTLTVLTDRTLFTDATENIHSSQRLVAHELAHQWFGNYVTCKDWSHVWLNEGFATYYAHLYDGRRNGRDALLYRLYKDARRIFERENNLPMVYKAYDDARDQFDYRAYKKGGWVLQMLRAQLGEDLYRRCIQTYLERYALQSVVTEDLNRVIEELSGRSYDQFFDQWVYHGGHPELEVSYSWQEADKLAKVTVKQTQEVNNKVLLFTFPTKVRFQTEMGVVDREVVISKKHHDFYFPLEKAPTVVRFDPDYGVLAKVQFKKPREMLYAQLADAEDVVGRLLAVEALKSKEDKKTVEKLEAVLNEDPFYGVRIKASGALREIHTREAFNALAASVGQPDARVRRQVVEDLGGFYLEASLAENKKILESEKNPDILAEAIQNLSKYPSPDTRKLLLRFLKSRSYRNTLAAAAIQAIRDLDDPTYIEPVQKILANREDVFTSWGFGQGLDALAYIARNEENRDRVRLFLAGYVNHKKKAIQRWAITALGTLRDPKAIGLVSTFAGGDDDRDWIQRAAEKALESLRDVKKVPVELKDLREEVLELKKDSERIGKDLDDLKKRFEAKEESVPEEDEESEGEKSEGEEPEGEKESVD